MGVCLCRQLSTTELTKMAEAHNPAGCNCATKPSSSSAICATCHPSLNQVSENTETSPSQGAVPRESVPRRTFRNLSLGCRKSSKSKEKTEKSSKSKLSWTLSWRLKSPTSLKVEASAPQEPMIDLARFNPSDYPVEDKDEVARIARAREIAEGIEMEIESLPSCYRLQSDDTEENAVAKPQAEMPPAESTVVEPQLESRVTVAPQPNLSASLIEGLTVLLHRSLAISMDSQRAWNVLTHGDLHFLIQHFHWHQHQHGPQGMFTLTPRNGDTSASNIATVELEVDAQGREFLRQAHTQVDYLHCLVPDLLDITKCSFYWGKMDRYEAERLLENRADGTFLLRDSAQEEYLFSVSFRRYNRSLHARIEQWNHRFSFDSHDPGVYSSPTILGLIDHYKNPELCMFFEPTLTLPLHRNSPFTLQHLSRAVICSNITYDGVSELNLPKALKLYLKEYHYKQRIRVRRLDG
ncbi:hypothetical protein GHT06_016603 [Daphnia sinensis]|uniref:EOG090X0BEM n=1 Tax=Daphnia sinensis TaxID=1820382 RepID=A0AAD5KNT7_9CRUS|nr:hypothetical protein GHT06_016603 [Daphnia sinensis]